MQFKDIFIFEEELARFSGSPYAIATCSCTQAIELCMRVLSPSYIEFSCYTYMGIIMLLKNLDIKFKMIPEKWHGMYEFKGCGVWDSARCFKPNMYIPNSYICLSFGENKPLDLGRGGAILLDNKEMYDKLNMLRFDGKDVSFDPWISQRNFDVGYHYKMNNRESIIALQKLNEFKTKNDFSHDHTQYRDCRNMRVKGLPNLFE